MNRSDTLPAQLHEKAQSHFIRRLDQAVVDLEPYPHFYIEQVFPEDYYQLMIELLPTQEAYRKWTDVGKVKLEQYSRRDQCYLEPEWLNAQPPKQRNFWLGFAEWFLGDRLAQAAMQKFSDTLVQRFKCPASAWPEIFTQAIFLRHRADYYIGPHTDIPSKVVNILLYLPETNLHEELGTSILVPKDASFSCPGTRHHEFEDFREVKISPYRRNSAFGFVKTDYSWHGVKPIGEQAAERTPRDVIQYMIYDNPMRAPRKDQSAPQPSEE